MSQQTMLFLLAFLLVLGFALYPALMWRLLGDLARGVWSLLVDAIGCLLAWI